jgi:hypothetical protein
VKDRRVSTLWVAIAFMAAATGSAVACTSASNNTAGPADASNGDDDASSPRDGTGGADGENPGDAQPSDGGGANVFDATFPTDGAVPSIEAGVMTAAQENGGPSPYDVILVGCPSNGLVEVAPYEVTENLGVTAYGPFLGAFSAIGSQMSITVPSPKGGHLIDIEFDTSNPIAGQIAPFAYSATVVIDPALVSPSRPFRAVMLNPQQPAASTLGAWNSDVLVKCP